MTLIHNEDHGGDMLIKQLELTFEKVYMPKWVVLINRPGAPGGPQEIRGTVRSDPYVFVSSIQTKHLLNQIDSFFQCVPQCGMEIQHQTCQGKTHYHPSAPGSKVNQPTCRHLCFGCFDSTTDSKSQRNFWHSAGLDRYVLTHGTLDPMLIPFLQVSHLRYSAAPSLA